MKGKQGVAATPLAQALQPTVAELARLVVEVGTTVVQPTTLYPTEERLNLGARSIAVGKAPAAWTVEGIEDTYRHVLLVGVGAVSAHGVVTAVEAMGKGAGKPGHVGQVSALVLAPPAAKADTTVAGVLASMGPTRAGLALAGRVLDVQVRTTRVECVPTSLQEVGPMWSTGHVALLSWRLQGEGADREEGRDLVPPPREATGSMRMVCIRQTQLLRQGQADAQGTQRAKAQEWARECCQGALGAAIPGVPQPAMEVAWRGDAMKVTFAVRTSAVPVILASSGRVLGVAFRPYVVTGVPLPPGVEAGLIHLRLPDGRPAWAQAVGLPQRLTLICGPSLPIVAR